MYFHCRKSFSRRRRRTLIYSFASCFSLSSLFSPVSLSFSLSLKNKIKHFLKTLILRGVAHFLICDVNIIFNVKGRDCKLFWCFLLHSRSRLSFGVLLSCALRLQGAVNFIFFLFFLQLAERIPPRSGNGPGACNERGVTCAAMRGEQSGGHICVNMYLSVTKPQKFYNATCHVW